MEGECVEVFVGPRGAQSADETRGKTPGGLCDPSRVETGTGRGKSVKGQKYPPEQVSVQTRRRVGDDSRGEPAGADQWSDPEVRVV